MKIVNVLFPTAIGGRVLDGVEDERERRFEQELEDAVAAAEARAERERQRSLMRLRRQLDDEKAKALKAQNDHFEQVAKRVAEQRDR